MRERDIYLEAVEIADPQAQISFLDLTCGNDSELRQQVDALLSSNAAADNFLETPLDWQSAVESADLSGNSTPNTAGGLTSRTVDSMIGAEIAGRYTVQEVLGRGGMGTVYAAWQSSPVKRNVALKLIRGELATKSVQLRFEAERQALALMDHPHIAQVYDGGTTVNGQLFFVMELVSGIPVTRFCDEQRLSIHARLELFVSVCSAVQHAHQKGIIHRDLKPGNILVADADGKPMAKVIDFGVAKATQQRLTEATLAERGAIIGTPDYMSPEQADPLSSDVDTRTDVYSLGAVLYELLAGSPPFRGLAGEPHDIIQTMRLVREADALRPSEKLRGAFDNAVIAQRRGMEPAKLLRGLQAELDWIVLKALEKDRTRRYETANGLAADIQRYLQDEPIVARPPSAGYRVRKLIRRHKLTATALLAVAASLVVGISLSVWQAVRADRESQRVAAVLNELREAAPAFAEQARGLALLGRFREAEEKLAYASKLQPDLPEYHVARGDLLQSELRLPEAAAAYREALTLNPQDDRAARGAALSEELVHSSSGEQRQLSAADLRKLYRVMQEQQRPVAEILPIARQLDLEKEHLLDYWKQRLLALPIYTPPGAERLKARDDGLLDLDLRYSGFGDLRALVGMPLGGLDVSGSTEVDDFTVLAEFRSLKALKLSGTKIDDLEPLRGLPLESLVLSEMRSSSVTLPVDMPKFYVNRLGTRVTDLSPLAGLALREFQADSIDVADFSSLAGAPLEICVINAPNLKSLDFLRGAPLKELSLSGCDNVAGLAQFSEFKSLEYLILPQVLYSATEEDYAALERLRDHAGLKRLDFFAVSESPRVPVMFVADFWAQWNQLGWIRELRRMQIEKVKLRFLTDRTWELRMDETSIRDLSVLRGAQIANLHISGTQVSNLSPLVGMPLYSLQLARTKVTDLSPLAGMPLQSLNLGKTQVADLSVVRGMPLRSIRLNDCELLIDLSPLKELADTLVEATLPPNPGDVEFLRTFPRMRRLAFRNNSFWSPEFTATQFWHEWDGGTRTAASRAGSSGP
ncbi:MAG: protein kinase domain-containing protein [Planctomycetales bacterium]